jgi:hyperosmotically inducible protein
MKSKLVAACFLLGTLAALPGAYAQVVPTAAEDRSAPPSAVSEAVITVQVRAELAKDKHIVAKDIKVEADKKGVVQLSGTARTQQELDRAVQIARNVKGVVAVDNRIQLASDR